MSFNPAQFLGQPLPQLVAGLARLDPAAVSSAELVELHSSLAGADAVSCRPTTLMLSTTPDANLPAGYPDVELPGVVLEKLLGGGGQGYVYVGRVVATNHVVAVKVLRTDYVASQGIAAREAMLCARVRHRNILRVFRTQEAGAFWVVIMELVQGAELHRRLLTDSQLRHCFGQLADALVELRQHHIVHCDIKPANILLRENDQSPVLVDFGIAQDLDDPMPPRGISGTPYYMAPEIFRDNQPHPAWDAYSLGVTAAMMLAGKQKGFNNLRDMQAAKLSGEFDAALRREVGQISDADFREWILALTSSEKEKRLAAIEAARAWRTVEPSAN